MASQKKDEYLAKPSGECCLSGHLHSGTPRGKIQTVAGIETYVSHPSESKSNGHIVFYFPDVYGLFTNGQLVMDSIADAGYLTVGLDYFNGDPVTLHRTDGKWSDPTQTFEEWIAKYVAIANGYVPKWIEGIKAEFGKAETKYACTGYCFGAPYVMESLAPSSIGGKPVCSAGAFAHPAMLTESHFRNVQSPLFLSCAETDFTFGTDDRNKAVDILREGKKDYQVQLFSKVSHGFALRCNLDDPYEKMVKEQSLRGIIDWFDFWLGSAGSKTASQQTANMNYKI